MKKVLILLSVLLCMSLTGCGNSAYDEALKHIDNEEYKEAYNLIDKISNDEDKETIMILINWIFIDKIDDGLVIMGDYGEFLSELSFAPNNYDEDEETSKMEADFGNILEVQRQMPVEILSADFAEIYSDYFALCAKVKLFLDEVYPIIFNDLGRLNQEHSDKCISIASDLYELSTKLTRIGEKYSTAYLPEELLTRYNLNK